MRRRCRPTRKVGTTLSSRILLDWQSLIWINGIVAASDIADNVERRALR